ncbi:NUDIX hydrolase [Nocardioides marmoribigeumensis]|uniref:8-oxo-dGTP diphosphatase n=1 Tax=Nocardioides marmoribigeumensis TaxID=433649 RepID=A0ABU2BTU6_9ACTN|nr:NUDIX hydrolase [Nocardioides marmoribigeumensis]MDR7362041.1 8-oxo-dGTP diphosphatase [Nocardioides marmoribigeumensis]
MAPRGPVLAAGAVTLRRRRGTSEVLLVHRPKYDDWSFPKGKLELHESPRTAAVREVLEETGVRVRLGPPLGSQAYLVENGTGRLKHVHYWVGRALGDHDVSSYTPNEEVDEVRWVTVEDAPGLLTYDYDRQTLAEAAPYAKRSVPLVVLRHAQAAARSRHKGDDRRRGLTVAGGRQAERLVPMLQAYGVTMVVSSSSDRCWRTVAPYAAARDLGIEVTHGLCEEDASAATVVHEVARLLEERVPAVLCTHRPVLPMVLETLGLEPTPVDPGAAIVVHHRHGRIVAIERIEAPSGR